MPFFRDKFRLILKILNISVEVKGKFKVTDRRRERERERKRERERVVGIHLYDLNKRLICV